MGIQFGPDFTFGVATASYQVEGAVHEGGRGVSIWDTFSHTPGKTFGGQTGDVACDHYHRVDKDLDTMVELGVDSYRFSIDWPRIQPNGTGPANQAGIDFYSHLVDKLLERGITPFATLYHWDLPQALEDKGGWPARDTAYRFADYTDLVAQALGDRVAMWATLNEPWCTAMVGYASGEHAPGLHSPAKAIAAAHHLNLAHGLAVQALRSRTTGKIGVVLNIHQIYPESDSAEDVQACRTAQAAANWIFSDPMLQGCYDDLTIESMRPHTDWEFVHDGDMDLIHQDLDMVGLNYYFPSTLRAGKTRSTEPTPWVGAESVEWVAPRPPLTQMGWPIDPHGLTDQITDFHQRYPDVDLVVSENGAAMPDKVSEDGIIHDQDRIDYLDSHIRAVHDALDAGAPVKGYYLWALMDNFEWAHGYSKRFGILHMNYDTLERTWKDSARWYQQFLATRTLP